MPTSSTSPAPAPAGQPMAPTPSTRPDGFATRWDTLVQDGDLPGVLALLVDPAHASDVDALSTRQLGAALRRAVNAPDALDDLVQDLLPRLLEAGAHLFDGANPIAQERSPFEDALLREDDRRARWLIAGQAASCWAVPPWALRALVNHPHRPGVPPLFDLALDRQWDNTTGHGTDSLRLWTAVLQRGPVAPESPDQLGATQTALLHALRRNNHRVLVNMDHMPALLDAVVDLKAVRGERPLQRAARQVLLLDTLVNDLRWPLPEDQATRLLRRAIARRASGRLARHLVTLGAVPHGMEQALTEMEAVELRQAMRERPPGTPSTPRARASGPRRRL